MSSQAAFLSASEAARRLGVSAKALRIYEQRGLLAPSRTSAGYRAYGADEMARATEIVALRALGLTLAQVGGVLDGDVRSVELALTTHEATLERQIRELVSARNTVRDLRADLARAPAPDVRELSRVLRGPTRLNVAFELPWPWGGERFELSEIRPITHIVGPLGSGKTRFAQRLAENLPNAAYLGLERAAGPDARTGSDPVLKERVDQALAWLIDEGATVSDDLIALLAGLEAEGPDMWVVDMVEQGLDQATQEALIVHLRCRARAGARPLFLMTRSSAILDLSIVSADEAIIFCPANHSPPLWVVPCPGAAGYEAVAMCLASPEVRARTAGMIAVTSRARIERAEGKGGHVEIR